MTKNIAIPITLILSVLFFPFYGAYGIEKTQRINPESDFEYLGAFRLPTGIRSFTMTFNPGGDPNGNQDGFPGSLFSTKLNINNGQVTEFNIPSPVILSTKNVNDLPIAQTIQGLADITGGRTDGQYTGCNLTGLEYFPKIGQQTEDKLYWTIMTYYVNPCKGTFGWANLNLSDPQSSGMWKLNGLAEAVYGNYIFEIPKSWADTYANGKYLVVGRYREGGGNSGGPGLFAIAPWEQGNPPADGTLLDYKTLLYYNLPNRVNELSNGDWWQDGAWLEAGNKSAVIFAGNKATRTKDSGTGYYGGPLPDSCGSSGYHSEPNYAAVLFYDPNDLADVAMGLKQSYEPQPYLTMQMENYLFYKIGLCNGGGQMGGVAYDRTNNLLYMAEARTYSSDYNSDVVHVFRVRDAAQSPDSTPPTAPANVSFTHTLDKITLKWDASTDTSGKVIYTVYRQGRPMGILDSHPVTSMSYSENEYAPVAVTRDTTFTDTKFKYFIAPYEYKIEARDVVGNTSSSEIIVPADRMVINSSRFLDDGVGSVRHKIPDGINGIPYSFQFQVEGGTPPYTWSATAWSPLSGTAFSELPGMDLNSSTGMFSGTPDLSTGMKANAAYTSDITVTDSAMPVANIATIYKLSAIVQNSGDVTVPNVPSNLSVR